MSFNAVIVHILFSAAAAAKSQYLHKCPANLISSTPLDLWLWQMFWAWIYKNFLLSARATESRREQRLFSLFILRIILNCLHIRYSHLHNNLESQITSNRPKLWVLIINLIYLINMERFKTTWELHARHPLTSRLGTQFGPVFMYRKPFVYTPRAKWGLCVGHPARSGQITTLKYNPSSLLLTTNILKESYVGKIIWQEK